MCVFHEAGFRTNTDATLTCVELKMQMALPGKPCASMVAPAPLMRTFDTLPTSTNAYSGHLGDGVAFVDGGATKSESKGEGD